MKKIKSFISKNVAWIIVLFISLTSVFLLKPNKATIKVYPQDLKESKQLSCSTKMGTTMFTKPNFEDHILETVDGTLFTYKDDQSKMAVEITGNKLYLITATAVEAGIMEPAEFAIVRENDSELIAVNLEGVTMLDPGINTFLLNKKSGTAVWTKSKPSFFGTALPDVQSYYMECR